MLLLADDVVDRGPAVADPVDMLVQAVRALLEPADEVGGGQAPLPGLDPADADVKTFEAEPSPLARIDWDEFAEWIREVRRGPCGTEPGPAQDPGPATAGDTADPG